MKISCDHGYYKFYPESVPAIKLLKSIWGVDVVQHGEFYTFAALKNAPNYSVLGYPFGLNPAIGKVTYSGPLEKILAKNFWVYNLMTGLIVEQVFSFNIQKPAKSDTYVLSYIPQAGGMADGKYFTSFYGELDFRTKACRIEAFYD